MYGTAGLVAVTPVSATVTIDDFNARSRVALTVDTRTATEYGVVRTFGQGDFQFNDFNTVEQRRYRRCSS